MTQFNVSVIGSLRNGYTATAEKIANNVSQVSNAPMKVKSAAMKVDASPLAPLPVPEAPSASLPVPEAPSAPPPKLSQANLQREKASLKLRRGAILSSINLAANKAQTAAEETLRMYGAVSIGEEVTSNATTTSEKAVAAAEVAVKAADTAVKAVMYAEDDVKAILANNDIEAEVGNAQIISKEAYAAVEKAIEAVNKINKGTVSSRNVKNVVIIAKKSTDHAKKIWDDLYVKMKGILPAIEAERPILANQPPSEIWKNSASKKNQNEIAKGEGMKMVNAAAEKAVLELVKRAAEKASDAATKANSMSTAVETTTTITSSILPICKTAEDTANEALNEAEKAETAIQAVVNAEAEVKAKIKAATRSNNAAAIVMTSMPMSKKAKAVLTAATAKNEAIKMSEEAAAALKEVVRLVNIAVDTQKSGAAMEALTAKKEASNQIGIAKRATDSAMKAWNEIYNTMKGTLQMGGRKHTQRKHKHKQSNQHTQCAHTRRNR